ncbi:MAG: hypothetical protein WCY19_01040 [Candidatus Gastranaerophilaceae bacterium]
MLNSGDVYCSKRDDTADIKIKYQLYLDERNVLLINSEKSKRNVSVLIKKEECKLLSHDSYLCIDNLFTYDKKYKILDKGELATSAIERIISLVSSSATLLNCQIKHIKKLLMEVKISRGD